MEKPNSMIYEQNKGKSRKRARNSSRSPDQAVLTWIRKHICHYSWGSGPPGKKPTWQVPSRQIRASYDALRLGVRPRFKRFDNKQLIDHCFAGSINLYGCASPATYCPEVLAQIDVDCHDGKGTPEEVLACVAWLREHGFPGLFAVPSNNGIGQHAYFVVRKAGDDASALDKALVNLEKWLRAQWDIHKWDISGIEVKGRPPLIEWGEGSYNVIDIKLGTLMRLPYLGSRYPEELMATASVRLFRLSKLRPPSISQAEVKDIAVSLPEPIDETPVEGWFGEIQDFEPSGLCPYSKRDREWPMWVEWVAKHGLYEEDSTASVLIELAVWLLWVEQVEEDKVVTLLSDWIMFKHKSLVTRINAGREKDVLDQVRRAVRTAGKLDAEGKAFFCQLRQCRSQGRYSREIIIRPILESCRGSYFVYLKCNLNDQDQVDDTAGSISSVYLKCNLNDTPLPAAIESLVVEFAGANGMRKTGGEYPLLRFARRFFNHLWDRKGSSRINRGTCLKMSGSVKPNLQLQHKKNLVKLGLLERDWEKTIRRGSRSALYRMTPRCKEIFQQVTAKRAACDCRPPPQAPPATRHEPECDPGPRLGPAPALGTGGSWPTTASSSRTGRRRSAGDPGARYHPTRASSSVQPFSFAPAPSLIAISGSLGAAWGARSAGHQPSRTTPTTGFLVGFNRPVNPIHKRLIGRSRIETGPSSLWMEE